MSGPRIPGGGITGARLSFGGDTRLLYRPEYSVPLPCSLNRQACALPFLRSRLLAERSSYLAVAVPQGLRGVRGSIRFGRPGETPPDWDDYIRVVDAVVLVSLHDGCAAQPAECPTTRRAPILARRIIRHPAGFDGWRCEVVSAAAGATHRVLIVETCSAARSAWKRSVVTGKREPAALDIRWRNEFKHPHLEQTEASQ